MNDIDLVVQRARIVALVEEYVAFEAGDEDAWATYVAVIGDIPAEQMDGYLACSIGFSTMLLGRIGFERAQSASDVLREMREAMNR